MLVDPHQSDGDGTLMTHVTTQVEDVDRAERGVGLAAKAGRRRDGGAVVPQNHVGGCADFAVERIVERMQEQRCRVPVVEHWDQDGSLGRLRQNRFLLSQFYENSPPAPEPGSLESASPGGMVSFSVRVWLAERWPRKQCPDPTCSSSSARGRRRSSCAR